MLRRKIFWMGIILLGVLTAYYCGGNGNGDEEPEQVIADPSFSSHIQPIFNGQCALGGCHNSTAQAGLNLTSGAAYANLVNVNSTQEPNRIRVIPSDAVNSYLVIKIEGNQIAGVRMPKDRSPLSSVSIQNIKNWINRGAKNN